MHRQALLWFRRDLRLADNAAVQHAIAAGYQLVPVFIWALQEEGDWPPGTASRWWLQHSLTALQSQLAKIGGNLLIQHGASAEQLLALAQAYKADLVIGNRLYEPAALERDAAVQLRLNQAGIELMLAPGALLSDPTQVRNALGKPYRVFTAYYHAVLKDIELSVASYPELLSSQPFRQDLKRAFGWQATQPGPHAGGDFSAQLASLGLLPAAQRTSQLHKHWIPGEVAAQLLLQGFVHNAACHYTGQHDLLGANGTSRLSPYLHFGEVAPHRVWSALATALSRTDDPRAPRGIQAFLRQLVWRDFAHYLLYHFPQTSNEPYQQKYNSFPWQEDPPALHAWQAGRTGYPVVDAAMQQLLQTGWMHNRARMIVASFLTKHLLQPWQAGARWFWEHLVDADLANNSFGWQWAAGCGADAAPYFRIFNPVLQGLKFDPHGEYVRKYLPQLAHVGDKYIHQPWRMLDQAVKTSDCLPALDYPPPMIDHTAARNRALGALAAITRSVQ